MKKALSLLLTLAVLLSAVSFASAEETPENRQADLLDLWDFGGESPVWVASVIPVSSGIVIAPAAVKDIPAEQLGVTDGVHAWEAAAVIPDERNRFTLVFFDEDTAYARYGAWEILPQGESLPAESCTVRYGDAAGSRINRGVLMAGEMIWQGQRCFLLSLTDEAPAGSPVLTQDGRLAGIVIAQWAEGINRVLMLPAEGIVEAVSGVAGLLAGLPEWSEAPQGLSVSLDKNRVTVDWHEMDMPDNPESLPVYMVIVDTGNNYLNSFPAAGNTRSFTLLLTPGRFYVVGPVVSEDQPDEVPVSYVSFFVPQAEKLTDYGFTPVRTAIAEAPEDGLKQGGEPVPVTDVTEELLRSGRAYFYSHSTYSVTKDVDGISLLVTLTDPEGNNYRYESAWVYSPEYMAADIWYLPLKEMGLTTFLDADGYPAGVYEVAYYVDGRLADAFEFELK